MKSKKILTIIFGLIFILSALWASGEPDESATSSAIIISSAVSITVCISAALILRKLNEEERGK